MLRSARIFPLVKDFRVQRGFCETGAAAVPKPRPRAKKGNSSLKGDARVGARAKPPSYASLSYSEPSVPPSLSLHRLVQPVSLEQFASTHLGGNEWLFAPHSAPTGDPTIARWVSARLSAKDFADIAATELDADSGLAASLLEGSTLELRQLHRRPGRPARLASELSLALGLAVRCSATLCPAGFAEDPADTLLGQPGSGPRLLLQLQGRRTWHLEAGIHWEADHTAEGAATTTTPTSIKTTKTAATRPPTAASLTTSPGDVLFLPIAQHAHSEPAGESPSLHLELEVAQRDFTWGALLSLLCRRTLIVAKGLADQASGSDVLPPCDLDDLLLAESARIRILGTSKMPSASPNDGENPSANASTTTNAAPADPSNSTSNVIAAVLGQPAPSGDSLAIFLPALLQHVAYVEGDLPVGFLETVEKRTKALLKRLLRIGHLDQKVDVILGTGEGGKRLEAKGVPARLLLEAVHSSSEDSFRNALLWTLGALRLRQRLEIAPTVGMNDPIASISNFAAWEKLGQEPTYRRSLNARPLLVRTNKEAGWVLIVDSEQKLVLDDAEAKVAKWCLGKFSGANGKRFQVDKDLPRNLETHAEVASKLCRDLFRLGVLEVLPPPPKAPST